MECFRLLWLENQIWHWACNDLLKYQKDLKVEVVECLTGGGSRGSCEEGAHHVIC
jgi:hypothetical protein